MGAQAKTQAAIEERGLFEDLSSRYPPDRNAWTRPDLLERGKYLCVQRTSNIPFTHVPLSTGGPRDIFPSSGSLSSDASDNGPGCIGQPDYFRYLSHLSSGIFLFCYFKLLAICVMILCKMNWIMVSVRSYKFNEPRMVSPWSTLTFIGPQMAYSTTSRLSR